VFKKIRALPTSAVVVDGGDFTPGFDDTLAVEKSGLMLETMPMMGYDAVGLGETDLIRGVKYLDEASKVLPLVCANLKLPPDVQARIPAVRWLDVDGHRVAVTGYVDPLLYYSWPGAFDRSPDSLTVVDPIQALIPIIEKVRPEADLVIVLAHGDKDEIGDWLAGVPPVDVVVQGHDPEVPHGPLEFEGTYLVRSGPRSRRVAQLDLNLIAPHAVKGFHFKLWDLSKIHDGDMKLDAIVNAFNAEHGLR
jgi:5'-nucleotidase